MKWETNDRFGYYSSKKFTYKLNGAELQCSKTERDLGVMVSHDLKSTNQCIAAYKKAYRILGLIKRTVVSRGESILIALYKSLVRPHVEFCCSA